MYRLFILFYVSTYDYDKTWAFIVGLMEENKAFVLYTVFKNHQKCSKFSNIYFVNLKWLDGVQVKNMVEKGGGIKARPGSLRSLSVLRLGCGLKSIKEQPGWFFAIFRKFLGRVLFFDKTQPAM